MDARGFIEADDRLETSVRGVFAVGDVTGKLPFTHAADEMGRLAAGNALGKGVRGRFRTHWVPWTTFTTPEVARVGMTESEAAAHGGRVAELPLDEMDRAITDGATQGFIKLIAGPRPVTRNAFGGKVLGATIVAPRAGEMIHEAALAMRAGLFTGRLAPDGARVSDLVLRHPKDRRPVLRRGRGPPGPSGPPAAERPVSAANKSGCGAQRTRAGMAGPSGPGLTGVQVLPRRWPRVPETPGSWVCTP